MNENLVKVSFIRRKGEAALVEYADDKGLCSRVLIPPSELVEKEGRYFVASSILNMGIVYGIPFQEELPNNFVIHSTKLVKALHQNGIWTVQDYENNPKAVRAAILEVVRELLVRLNSIVTATKRRT